MVINIDHINKIFKVLMDKVHSENIKSIEIKDKDFYWLIGAPEWTDMSKNPEPVVGSFHDDWECLMKINSGEDITTYVDLDRFASILRLISEELNPVE